MSEDTQTMLDAIPLLVVGGLYFLVSVSLIIPLLRERRAPSVGVGVWLLFTLVAVMATVIGVLRIAGRDVFGDESDWLVIAGSISVAVPGLIVLVRRHERSLLVSGLRRVREAEERATERGREADASSRLSLALSRTRTAGEAAAFLFDEVEALLRTDALMLALVDEEARRATGFAARGVDEGWWKEVTLDLDADEGALVAVARERATIAIYDVKAATNVNRRLAEAVDAKSAAFVPLISEGQVAGVLVAATIEERRNFSSAELDVVASLASEAALALGRARSNEALTAALERERLIAEIGRRVRSELDLDAVLQVAVEETARAVGGVSRTFVRLGAPGESTRVVAEWTAPGVGLVGEMATRLPALNLAARDRRVVVVHDTESAPELDDPELGDASTMVELGTRAVLDVPILVFNRLIGVFGLHRSEPTRWLPGEVALAEAVGRELGLAIHTASLLRENERRIRQQETLIEAAQVLTSDLRFDSVIRRLVQEVVALTGAEAADCWILEPDRKLLRCRAVVGVPEWNVGRLIPPEGTIGRALESGSSVLTHDFASTEQPPPSPPYAVFDDVMCAPITWLGEARGVLGVCSREAGRFDEADVEMLEVFARLASLALHNAESFEERGRQAQVQRGFYRVADVLSSPLSLSQTLDALAQAASEALGGASAAVLELKRDELRLAGSHALPDAAESRLDAGIQASDAPFARAAAEERVLSSSELADDDRFDISLRELLVGEGYGALLCAPVAGVRDQTFAVVVLFHETRDFTDDDVLLTQHLSGAARGALERGELFETERRARRFSQRLAEVGALLATSLDPALVIEEVVREAPRLLGAEASVIRLLEGDELVVQTAQGRGTERLRGTSSSSAFGISGAVVQSRAPVALADVRTEPRLAQGDDLLERDAVACVAVPMSAHGGGLYGVLGVYSSTPRRWREDEIQSLAALGAAGSAAVANAELYQRVAEEKERSGAILAHIADGIVAVGRDDRIVLWNRMAEQITGVPASEALGRLVPDVLQRDLAAGGEHPPGERQVAIRRGSSEVWLALSEAVMLDPGGAVAGRIFAFRDVSSERVVEQMKSDFVSTVSHELRTPLTSIYGFAETLMRSDVDFAEPERVTFLRYIASESERLIQIVDDLLNVARLEAGTLAVSVEPVAVAEAARAAAAAAETHADGQRFAVDIVPGNLVVSADREKLIRVLANLLDNAVKYSPEGGTITLSARRRANAAEIVVADEGLGIPRSDQQRIFTKFFRTDRGAPGPGGTGLGLFLVRGLVAAMGGRIWVESEEGRGSRFTFDLPLAGGEPAEPSRVEAAVRS